MSKTISEQALEVAIVADLVNRHYVQRADNGPGTETPRLDLRFSTPFLLTPPDGHRGHDPDRR
jgi:hypothetical protein